MSRPVRRCSPPKDILQIQSRTSFDEQSDYFIMAAPSRLVKRCGVGVSSDWVVSVRIFPCVKQQPNDLDMTKVRCQRERQVAILTVGIRKQPTSVARVPQGRRDRQVHMGTALEQRVH
jgi:hypothetical protein